MNIYFVLAAAASLCAQAFAFDISPETGRRNFIAAASVAAVSVFSPSKSFAVEVGGKIRFGDESIMTQKGHGTSASPAQSDLLYGVSEKLADKICNFNR
jgi:hypothetical protein